MRFLVSFLVLLILMVQYRIWVGEDSLAGVWRLEQNVVKQQRHNSELKLRNERLAAEIADLKKGGDAIEARARRDLGMIGRDETLYQFSKQ